MRSLAKGAGLALLGAALAAGSGRAQGESAGAGEEKPLPPPGTLMVFVNTQALLPETPGAVEAQETFNQELAAYRAEMQALQAEVDSLLAAYRRQEAMLTPGVKEQRQQEILQKQQQLQQRRLELEQRAGQRQQELLEPILERVSSVIEEVRRERGYTVVLDIASSGVVAADPRLDITTLVLERLKGTGEAADTASRRR